MLELLGLYGARGGKRLEFVGCCRMRRESIARIREIFMV